MSIDTQTTHTHPRTTEYLEDIGRLAFSFDADAKDVFNFAEAALLIQGLLFVSHGLHPPCHVTSVVSPL